MQNPCVLRYAKPSTMLGTDQYRSARSDLYIDGIIAPSPLILNHYSRCVSKAVLVEICCRDVVARPVPQEGTPTPTTPPPRSRARRHRTPFDIAAAATKDKEKAEREALRATRRLAD